VANTRGVGSFYWHAFVYPIKPPVLWERAETQEIAEPFRFGIGISLRLPLTRLALVMGRWTAQYEEGQALTNAIKGRVMEEDEVNWDTVRYGAMEVES